MWITVAATAFVGALAEGGSKWAELSLRWLTPGMEWYTMSVEMRSKAGGAVIRARREREKGRWRCGGRLPAFGHPLPGRERAGGRVPRVTLRLAGAGFPIGKSIAPGSTGVGCGEWPPRDDSRG